MRELINDGVDLYKEKKFTDSEVNFKKGLEKAPESFAANFNLGDAYYKQQRYEDALGSFQNSLASAQTDDQKAKVYHNIGNSLLKSDKIKESIEAYKKALKLNPNDADTKYNLSYALNLLKQQQNQQQNQNDKNKDKNDDKQDQQNQNDQNKDKNKDEQKQDQKQDQNKQQDQQQKPDQNQQAQQDNLKQKEQKISQEEAERILQALMNNEKDLQKKLRKQKGTPVKTEKDW
jgi:tetratricopeptide (TPR) repeat protein